MEALQTYLPQRVPALSDWLLNTLGALAGAWLASAMERLGAIDHWSRFRSRWFARDARTSIVLLATWPAALLFPPAVPFGLGQVFERLETVVENVFANTPFLQWLPVRSLELQPMAPVSEVVCVALGLLAPCLLGYAIIEDWGKRLRFFIILCGLAVFASSLSAALSYGPESAWAWVNLPVWIGLVCGACHTLHGPCATRLFGVVAGGIGLAAQPGQPGAQHAVFCANPARLGAGPLHPLSWSGTVAGLGMALHGRVGRN
jgi:hypothetical protein